MSETAFQDLYPDEFSHCFGCGRNNPDGHHLKSYWHYPYEETIARITPSNRYTGGVPDHLYGGLIASLLDCHGTASAAAFKKASLGLSDDSIQLIRCVTGSLTVNFIHPTPIDCELTIIGKLISISDRKIKVDLALFAHDLQCATGEMLAIQLKEAQT